MVKQGVPRNKVLKRSSKVRQAAPALFNHSAVGSAPPIPIAGLAAEITCKSLGGVFHFDAVKIRETHQECHGMPVRVCVCVCVFHDLFSCQHPLSSDDVEIFGGGMWD